MRPPLVLIAISTLPLVSCGGEIIDLVGTVERTTLELAAPISEVIVEVPVKIGERVEGGRVLVHLDSAVAEAELRAFEAALAAARATLVEAEGEFSRFEDLRQARVATAQRFDEVKRQRDEAIALVAEKEARLAQAKKRLEDLSIRTYLPGVVDQLPYEHGERVPAGGVVAVVLAEQKPWVRVWLPARAVSRLAPGSAAAIEIEGYEQQLKGNIGEVSREAEFTPHYALTERERAHLVYETRVVIEDAPADLRPGLPARVRLRLDAAARGKGSSGG
jgi:HlyD family secretion protein